MAPAKGALRLLTEEWFGRNPYHLTHDSFVVNRGYHGRVRSDACQDCYDYVRTRLQGDDANSSIQRRPHSFVKKMRKATRQIRGPFGFVRANPNVTQRSIGDAASHVWTEVQRYLSNNPIARARHVNLQHLNQLRHGMSEHGQIMKMLRAAHVRDVRKNRLSLYQTNLDGRTAVDIGTEIRCAPLERLGGFSPCEYAQHVGGVYVFFSAQQSIEGIKVESIRFITDGQKNLCVGGNHNAVLMWNPRRKRSKVKCSLMVRRRRLGTVRGT